MAAHNTGGIVIVQVERVVAPGTLPARLVHLPGAIVDKVTPNLLLLQNSKRTAPSCCAAVISNCWCLNSI